MFGNSEDGCGNEYVPDGSPGGDTAKPALVTRFGDDDVGPGHLKPAECDACEDSDEGAGDWVADDPGAEEADDGAVEKMVDNRDVETAETRERTCFGAKMLDSRAYFGGDGRLLDKEEVGFDNLGLVGFLVLGEERRVGFIGVGILGFESCGGRSLDHGQARHNIAIGITDLVANC